MVELKYGFFRSNFLRNETLLSWTFPVIKISLDHLIKTLEWIRFSSNQHYIHWRGIQTNFDDWKCPTQQSSIPQEITS